MLNEVNNLVEIEFIYTTLIETIAPYFRKYEEALIYGTDDDIWNAEEDLMSSRDYLITETGIDEFKNLFIQDSMKDQKSELIRVMYEVSNLRDKLTKEYLKQEGAYLDGEYVKDIEKRLNEIDNDDSRELLVTRFFDGDQFLRLTISATNELDGDFFREDEDIMREKDKFSQRVHNYFNEHGEDLNILRLTEEQESPTNLVYATREVNGKKEEKYLTMIELAMELDKAESKEDLMDKVLEDLVTIIEDV